MIKNEKQYKITKKKLSTINEGIAEIYDGNKEHSAKKQLILLSLMEMKQQMELETTAYDLLKKDKANILKARSISDLPSLITEYKIISGLTQKEFSKRLGIKEQQLQRYEAEDFKSITFRNLLKILQSIGLDVKIKDTHVIPHALPRTQQLRQPRQ
jgi:hypothetical protein